MLPFGVRSGRAPVATRPSAATVPPTAPMSFIGGISGPMDVLFPSRDDSFQFRNDLETKYQTGLGRGPT